MVVTQTAKSKMDGTAMVVLQPVQIPVMKSVVMDMTLANMNVKMVIIPMVMVVMNIVSKR